MMFERFTGDARSTVVQAQEHARRLGHGYIGCEHLLLAAAATGEPASAVLRERGVTPQAVETQIVRLVGLGQAASLFSALDREALASVGIDLDAVRARIEAAFGPDAFTRAGPYTCRKGRPAVRKNPLARLRHPRCAEPDQYASPGGHTIGHIPFTPRAKKSLEHSLREAQARHDNYIGVEHLTLALVAMNDGAVPPILSALGASQAILRAAILEPLPAGQLTPPAAR
jgi:ATP-dependent Clp protease ATP-binding subunit ClpA